MEQDVFTINYHKGSSEIVQKFETLVLLQLVRQAHKTSAFRLTTFRIATHGKRTPRTTHIKHKRDEVSDTESVIMQSVIIICVMTIIKMKYLITNLLIITILITLNTVDIIFNGITYYLFYL